MSQLSLTIFSIINDKRPLPPQAATEEEDWKLFEDDPWIDGPIRVDYGTNLRYVEIYIDNLLEDYGLAEHAIVDSAKVYT